MCCYRYLRSKTKMGFSAYHLTGETEMEKGNRVVIPRLLVGAVMVGAIVCQHDEVE